jgi:hypothetical protein
MGYVDVGVSQSWEDPSSHVPGACAPFVASCMGCDLHSDVTLGTRIQGECIHLQSGNDFGGSGLSQ